MRQQFSRRSFLSWTTGTAAAAVAAGSGVLRAEEKEAAEEEEGVTTQDRGAARAGEKVEVDRQGKRKYPASHPVRLLADTFVGWQTPCGRLDPVTCPLATYGAKRSSHNFMCIALYRAYEATGIEAYKEAADRFAVFYLSVLCPVPSLRPAHFGMGLIAYREFKRHNPKLTDWDPVAQSLFEWMKPWRWDEGSYYRNGYGGGKMRDAGNITDNAHAGRGLMAYHAVTGRADVLAEAEGLSDYFLNEMKPGTYQGCWSSKLKMWAVAPTTQDRFEHFVNVCACDMAWGYAAIEGIDYLTQLHTATKRQDLKTAIPEKCVAAMKWQFDDCQFNDGAVGMSGRENKWVGMTAGAVLSFLRNRDAGFLSEKDAAAYRPKATAAVDWMMKNVNPKSISNGGFFELTDKSWAAQKDCRAWHLAWGLEALLRADEI